MKIFEFQVLATNAKYVSCPVGQTTWTVASARPVPHPCLCPLTFAGKRETRELARFGGAVTSAVATRSIKIPRFPSKPHCWTQESPSHERGETGGQADRCARRNRGRDGAERAEVSGDRHRRPRGAVAVADAGAFPVLCGRPWSILLLLCVFKSGFPDLNATRIPGQRLLCWGACWGVSCAALEAGSTPPPTPGTTTHVSRLCQMSPGGKLILTEKRWLKSHPLCTKYLVIMYCKTFYLEVTLDFKLQEPHKESHIRFTPK